jgi:C1A family cysteine protease
MTNRTFSLKPSVTDARDHPFSQEHAFVKKSVDLRSWDSPIEDQGELGACAGHAMTNAYELMVKMSYPDCFAELSQLYVYYHTRHLEKTVEADLGVFSIRNLITATKRYGACTEKLWPYDISKYKDQPTPECYVDALNRSITEYQSLQSVTDMLESLSTDRPIIIGLDVYESFLTLNAENPVVQMPTTDLLLGGHAMSVVGYSLEKEQFIAKNSFGSTWGDAGYCWLPFEYVKKYAFDRWCFHINNQKALTSCTRYV